MTAVEPVVERLIVGSWPLVGWWHVTGSAGHWNRHRLIGAALVEATTTTGTGKSRQQSVARYVTGLLLEVGQAELAEGGYFVCELDWPTCGCERPRTSDLDRSWCSRCARLVPDHQGRTTAPAPHRTACTSAVDLWAADHPQQQEG